LLQGLDIVVLACVAHREAGSWTQSTIAQLLEVSQSQVHYALKRAETSGLWSASRGALRHAAFLELAVHGMKYIFPPELGAPTRGVFTAHSAPPLVEHIAASQAYVWPYARGQDAGLALEPLHKAVPIIALQDHGVHELLALIDALRVGRVRERKLAEQLLKARLGLDQHAS